MIVTVDGYLLPEPGADGGIAYRAVLDPAQNGEPGALGCITGPSALLSRAQRWQGHVVPLSPTGPDVRADLSNPTHALAALRAATDVRIVDGEEPDDLPAGAVA